MWELHADLGSKAPDPHRLRLPLAQDQRLPQEDRPQRGAQEPAHGRPRHRPVFPRRSDHQDPQLGAGAPGGRRGLLQLRRRPDRLPAHRFRPRAPLGPGHQPDQMAKIMRDYRKTVGARLNKKGMKAVPEVELAAGRRHRRQASLAAGHVATRVMTRTSASRPARRSRSRPPTATGRRGTRRHERGRLGSPRQAQGEARGSPRRQRQPWPMPKASTQGYPVPKPRPKPIEVLMMAAVNMKIEPASAPPPDPTARSLARRRQLAGRGHRRRDA